jgi:hypothetical protein
MDFDEVIFDPLMLSTTVDNTVKKANQPTVNIASICIKYQLPSLLLN